VIAQTHLILCNHTTLPQKSKSKRRRWAGSRLVFRRAGRRARRLAAYCSDRTIWPGADTAVSAIRAANSAAPCDESTVGFRLAARALPRRASVGDFRAGFFDDGRSGFGIGFELGDQDSGGGRARTGEEAQVVGRDERGGRPGPPATWRRAASRASPAVSAQHDARMRAREARQPHRVLEQVRLRRGLRAAIDCSCSTSVGLKTTPTGGGAMPCVRSMGDLVARRWVAHRDADQEAIDLRFGQRVGAFESTGFCVASTKNGSGSSKRSPSMVTCRSCIASSSAD